MKYIRIEIPITKNRYMIAFIWKHKKEFRKATETSKDACFCGIRNRKTYPLLGELHFVKGMIGSGMVAHELEHAALDFVRKMGKSKNDEYLCETVQIMTINFWLMVQKNKTLNKWIYGKGK